MTYNIHPILVHFPIALLFLYSIIKILPCKKWLPNVEWTHLERAFLVVGVIGAFLALSSGESAQHLTHPNRQLVNMHANFAGLATFLYGALLVGEFLYVANPIMLPKISLLYINKILITIENILCNNTFSKFIAFIALIAISITGILGGVMVYGVSADPVAGTVLKILGIII